jgi:hypothetical protein
MPKPETIEIRNFTSPGRVVRVEKAKYVAMRDALMAVLPHGAPGLTIAEAKQKLLPLLPDDLFPDGAKAGWWLKAAQLDMEANGKIMREDTKPLKFHRT